MSRVGTKQAKLAKMSPELILAEARRRQKLHGLSGRMEDNLLPGIQSDVYHDKARQIAMVSVRSSGKTWGLLQRAISVALAGGDVAFISKTYRSVEDIAWETLLRICREYEIEISPNAAKLKATVANRGRICFYGADNRKFRDNIRGTRWSLIIVDEAGHFYSDLDVLVRQVLIPCTYARNGTIILTGTPYYVPTGLFFDLTRPSGGRGGWSVHECHDPFYNKYAEDDVRESMKLLKDEYGDGWDKLPHVRREFFAEWTFDTTKLVYKYNHEINTFKRYKKQPEGDYHVLGLDFSFTGRTGLVETVSNPDKHRAMFVRSAKSMDDVGLDQIDRLGPHLLDFHERTGGDIVFDHSQGFIKDALQEAFPELNFIPAAKTEKYTHIELFNSDLKTSRVLVNVERCEPLLWEWSKGTWQRNPDGGTPSGRPVPARRDKWDCSDACLYAWRQHRIRQHAGAPERAPKPGTPAFFERIAARLRRQAQKEVNQKSYFL